MWITLKISNEILGFAGSKVRIITENKKTGRVIHISTVPANWKIGVF